MLSDMLPILGHFRHDQSGQNMAKYSDLTQMSETAISSFINHMLPKYVEVGHAWGNSWENLRLETFNIEAETAHPLAAQD